MFHYFPCTCPSPINLYTLKVKKHSIACPRLAMNRADRHLIYVFTQCYESNHSPSANSRHVVVYIQVPTSHFRFNIPLIFSAELHLSGDSLVFIFPLATMLTFTSAVGKLNVRVLWHHHMLLQVISQSYCQVFVKSYNFVFEQIDKEGSPREK